MFFVFSLQIFFFFLSVLCLEPLSKNEKVRLLLSVNSVIYSTNTWEGGVNLIRNGKQGTKEVFGRRQKTRPALVSGLSRWLSRWRRRSACLRVSPPTGPARKGRKNPQAQAQLCVGRAAGFKNSLFSAMLFPTICLIINN